MAKKGNVKSLPSQSGDKWASVSAPVSEKTHPRGSAMFSNQVWKEIAHSLKLSDRELQIVRGVFNGQTEFSLANSLQLSPHTIHTYCERLYHKLAVTDRVKLVLRITNEFLALTAAPGSVLPSICANRTVGRCPLRRA
jgi:DNA-binding NarL/FixJ family response regulator